MDLKNNYLFEISWEVCHKDGGIYTVISSKADLIKKNINNYYLVGALRDKDNKEFISIECPEEFQNVKNELEDIGIKLHFGRWKINGEPNVILIEYLDYSNNINDIKGKLWNNYKIDSLGSLWNDFDEVILWSWCCGIAIEKLMQKKEENILVQSHEWMSGGAIFYLKQLINKDKFRCIFTTHATMLGRALSGGAGFDLIKEKNIEINSDEKAYEIGVHTKHQSEKTLAQISDCFTTVSDMTGDEAENFYSKKPDVLLYNGFDNSVIPNYDGLKVVSKVSRDETNNFLKKYFWNFYDVDIENSKIFFTSGRNEFVNKGWDLYANSLGKLNRRLVEENSDKNIISFFLVPVGDFLVDDNYKNSIENFNKNIKREKDELFAPISTHVLPIENEIIGSFLQNGLMNRKEDRVKVILVPLYLNGENDAMSRIYYEMILGLDLGVFVSYYEPWGYTPMEAISYGVATITTDRAGFGIYTNKMNKICECVRVLNRVENNFDESSEKLTEHLYDFNLKSNKDMDRIKLESLEFAKKFDWSVFIENYLKAFRFALK